MSPKLSKRMSRSAESDRFAPVETVLVELEAVDTDLGVRCRFTVDDVGDVWAFTVESLPVYLDADGVELDGVPEEDGYATFLSAPLTASWLRRNFKFEAALSEAKRQSKRASPLWHGISVEDAAERRERVAELEARRGDGRYDALHYARLAAVYIEIVEAGADAPLRVLADRENLSYATARRTVGRARDLGLLSPTSRGKGGGVLTAKAVELLAGEANK